MLTDIIATDNYVSFNIRAAHILGLNAAIYVSVITNIYNKAITKNKLDKEGFCIVDRDYITSRTTLSREDQIIADSALSKLNVIKISNYSKNNLSIDFNVLACLLTSEDMNTIESAKSLCASKKGEKKVSQRRAMINNLKSIASHPNGELDQAYKDWVEGVYSNPKGFLSKKSILIFMKSVDEYAQGDLDLALKIIDIATVNGYRECQWAINTFEKDFKKTFYSHRERVLIRATESDLSNMISKDEAF